MKRKRKIIYTKTRSSQITVNRETLIFLLFLTAGIVIGVFTAKRGNDDIIAQVKNIFDSFYSARESQSIIVSSLHSLGVSAAFWIMTLLFGLCAIGAPFIAVLPTIKGLGIGLVTGYIYSVYGLSGIGYCLLVIFPGALISFIALIYSVSDAFKMSVFTLGSLLNFNSQKGGADKFKIYFAKEIFYLLIFVISAFVDGIANKVFSGLFTFL